MQGQVDAAREYMDDHGLDMEDDADDFKESMLSGSPPKKGLDDRTRRRLSRSDKRDVGDVSDDDFESPHRGPGGRPSFSGGNPPARRSTGNQFLTDEELAAQDNGSAGQGADSTSGMNSMPKERQDPSKKSTTDNTASYNQASNNGAEFNAYDESADTTDSGGYGVNAGGDAFSPKNQSGIGGNAPGQFK